jgi:hypothetical protein
MTPRAAALAGGLMVMMGVTTVGQGGPKTKVSLADVLTRAGTYVVDYGQLLATVLAEESYTQQLVWRSNKDVWETRTLKSEIAFLRLTDSTEWLSFRNVLSIDGVPVPNAEGRLERLFRDQPRSLLEQVRVIASESARHNLGPITREVNVPTTALHYVHPVHQRDTRFDKQGEEMVGGERVWIVEFRERDSGGLISRADGRPVPGEGKLWIAPSDGRIVRTTLVLKNFVRGGGGSSKAQIDVTWRRDAALDLWVPFEMQEHYEGPWLGRSGMWKRQERYDIAGTATYSNYRRFSTSVRIIG